MIFGDRFQRRTLLKKLTIVSFKPKPECYNECLAAITKKGKHDVVDGGFIEHRVVRCDDELVAIVAREADKVAESAKQGVEWLDGYRHLQEEWNDTDRHTLAITGELVED